VNAEAGSREWRPDSDGHFFNLLASRRIGASCNKIIPFSLISGPMPQYERAILLGAWSERDQLEVSFVDVADDPTYITHILALGSPHVYLHL
jgi:hypothetical protein